MVLPKFLDPGPSPSLPWAKAGPAQDQDNDFSVGNYFWNTEKIFLDSARIYLVVIELCSLVLRQIVGVVHLLVCSTLALVSNHSWFVFAPKTIQNAIINDCNP